jgi:antibiotic biosynthesis monooxygenase (ABM) superfamily enzyme
MYGTVAMCSVLPENAERLMALAVAEDGLGIEGYLGTEIMVAENHSNTLLMVVRFQDRESYVVNADSPGQDERYGEFRALMESDPVWYDGEWVTSR